MGFVEEFRKFISRGNIVDIAIAFIIGAAFNKISTSLVSDIIMPPLGILINNVNFTELAISLKPAVVDGKGTIIEPAVAIGYGKFLESIIDFFIIAFAVFLIFKGISITKKKEPAKATPAPLKTDEVILLEQIRDILKGTPEKR